MSERMRDYLIRNTTDGWTDEWVKSSSPVFNSRMNKGGSQVFGGGEWRHQESKLSQAKSEQAQTRHVVVRR